MDSASMYFYLGVGGLIVSGLGFFRYHALSGEGVISEYQAIEMIKKVKPRPKFIDVRTQTEWDLGHVEGAIHIPISELSKENTKIKKLNKSQTYIIYCNTGNRARQAAVLMRDIGFKKIYYLESTWGQISDALKIQ